MRIDDDGTYLKLLETPASPPFTSSASMFPAPGAGMAGPPIRIPTGSGGNHQVVLDTSVHPLVAIGIVVDPLMVRPSV